MADLLLEHGADPNGQYGSAGYGPIVFGAAECNSAGCARMAHRKGSRHHSAAS